MTLPRRKLLGLMYFAPLVMAQNTAPPPSKPMFFHGTITKIEGETITIFRSLVGHKPETRKFIIKPATSIDRQLAVNEDVTVRYFHTREGDVALEIRVHPRPETGS